MLRDATAADVAAITAIYAIEVREHVNTYEYDVPDEAEMARRMDAIVGAGYPYIVAQEPDGTIGGYAYASSYRARVLIKQGPNTYNGKSLLGLLALARTRQREITVLVEGEEEGRAASHLCALFAGEKPPAQA